jgi:hypothetical protein
MLEEKKHTIVKEDSFRGNIAIETWMEILRDGRQVSKRLTDRKVYHPGEDLTGANPKVVALAASVWTDDCLSAWADFQAARQRP